MGRAKRPVMEYRNYELPPELPIVALTGDEWHISHVPSNRLHIHNCLEIGLCHTESGTIVLGDRLIPFHAGEITCIAKNVPHTTYSAPGCASLWSYLFLDPQTLLSPVMWERMGDNLSLKRMLTSDHMVLSPEQSPEAAPLVSAILKEMTERRAHYELAVRGLCMALIICLFRAYGDVCYNGGSEKSMYTLVPALDYIQARYMQSFPQSLLAELCYLSPTHFRRIFREQMGVSPLVFLHQTRILESCNLLRSTGMSIAEVAGRVGYATLSSFNRYFSRFIGCTPSDWRKDAGLKPRIRFMTYTGWTKAEKVPVEIEEDG